MYILICFPPDVIFRSRVIGVCPVTTDFIVAIQQQQQFMELARGLVIKVVHFAVGSHEINVIITDIFIAVFSVL